MSRKDNAKPANDYVTVLLNRDLHERLKKFRTKRRALNWMLEDAVKAYLPVLEAEAAKEAEAGD